MELDALETCRASEQGEDATPSPPPTIDITAASGATEGGDAVFTLYGQPGARCGAGRERCGLGLGRLRYGLWNCV